MFAVTILSILAGPVWADMVFSTLDGDSYNYTSSGLAVGTFPGTSLNFAQAMPFSTGSHWSRGSMSAEGLR